MTKRSEKLIKLLMKSKVFSVICLSANQSLTKTENKNVLHFLHWKFKTTTPDGSFRFWIFLLSVRNNPTKTKTTVFPPEQNYQTKRKIKVSLAVIRQKKNEELEAVDKS